MFNPIESILIGKNHGDLTMSNIMFSDKYYLIDFMSSNKNFVINKMTELHLLNWNLNGFDVGGMMTYWLNNKTKSIPITDELRWGNKDFNKDNIYYIRHLYSGTWDDSEMPECVRKNPKLIEFIKNDVRNQNNKYYCEIYDKKFLHYRGGGNWERRNMRLHVNLTLQLRDSLLD